MNRRTFLSGLTLGTLAAPLTVEAQQAGKVHRVGMMTDRQDHIEALRQGLRELGWVDGQNVAIESRGSDGRFARLPEAAAELVRLKVDVIVCGGSESVQAAKAATRTIPIVMTFVGDPIGQGFIVSYARPGGTITGLSNLSHDLDTKRLELLKEVAPRITRIAVLWNPPQPAHREALKNLEHAARALGVQLQPIALNGAEDLDGAFAAIRREGAGAVTMLGSGLHVANFKRIAELALKAKLLTVAWQRAFLGVGGLMMYGANEMDLVRRAASYVDRIMKGANPADLPVERPTKFELIINLKTARALGLTIPPAVLLRADQVLE